MSKKPDWREKGMGRFEIEAKTFDGFTEVVLVCNQKMADIMRTDFKCGRGLDEGVVRHNDDGTTEYKFKLLDLDDQRLLVDFIASFPSHYDIPMN